MMYFIWNLNSWMGRFILPITTFILILVLGIELVAFLGTKTAILPQLIWNGLISGALIALVALGLTLIYGVAGFIQFAHGEMVALGAYFFVVFHTFLGWPILAAALITIILVILVGLFLERFFFRPVRDKDSMIPLVISIGLSMGLQALILIFFGAGVLMISDQIFPVHSFGEHILATASQLWSLILSLGLMLGLISFLRYSKVGKSIRAVSSNREVAEIFGLKVNRSMGWVFGGGAGLAAIAGICLGFEQNLEPTMGVMISVKAFSAVILGAVGSVRGAILGAFLIGLSESLLVGLGVIPSGFQAAIPFVILIGMLLIKPEGLFGTRFSMLRQ